MECTVAPIPFYFKKKKLAGVTAHWTSRHCERRPSASLRAGPRAPLAMTTGEDYPFYMSNEQLRRGLTVDIFCDMEYNQNILNQWPFYSN